MWSAHARRAAKGCKPPGWPLKSMSKSLCLAAEDRQTQGFVAFEGMPHLYSDFINHRSSSGSWQAAAAGCRGLAATLSRAHLVRLPFHLTISMHEPNVEFPKRVWLLLNRLLLLEPGKFGAILWEPCGFC